MSTATSLIVHVGSEEDAAVMHCPQCNSGTACDLTVSVGIVVPGDVVGLPSDERVLIGADALVCYPGADELSTPILTTSKPLAGSAMTSFRIELSDELAPA